MSAEVIIVEVIGWTAAAIILAAYILLSLGKLDGRSYLYRSEEHTSELQSLMRISYAVFCLKKKNKQTDTKTHNTNKYTKINKTIKYYKHNNILIIQKKTQQETRST